MIKEKIGIKIREYRNQLGVSQEQFALSIGMDRTYLSSVEAGKRNISIENLYKIVGGLGISMGDFFKDI